MFHYFPLHLHCWMTSFLSITTVHCSKIYFKDYQFPLSWHDRLTSGIWQNRWSSTYFEQYTLINMKYFRNPSYFCVIWNQHCLPLRLDIDIRNMSHQRCFASGKYTVNLIYFSKTYPMKSIYTHKLTTRVKYFRGIYTRLCCRKVETECK